MRVRMPEPDNNWHVMRAYKSALQLAIVGLGRDSAPDLWQVIDESGAGCQDFDSAETFLAEAGLWDALICPIELPGMCGLELQRRLTVAGNVCPIWIVAERPYRDRVTWQLGPYSTVLKWPHASALAARLQAWPAGQPNEAFVSA